MLIDSPRRRSSDRVDTVSAGEGRAIPRDDIYRAKVERLTDKQRECMELVVMRKSSKEIARELGISKPTVDQRIASVRQIFGVNNRDEAAIIFSNATAIYDRVIYDPGQVPISAAAVDMSNQEVQHGIGLRLEEPASISLGGNLMDQEFVRPFLSWSTFEDASTVTRLLVMVGLTVGILVMVLVGLSVAHSISMLLTAS